MKLVLTILPVLWFLYHSSNPSFDRSPFYGHADTSIGPIVVPEFIDTLPDTAPPDTTSHSNVDRHNLIFEYFGGDAVGDYDKWHHTAATHCCDYSQVEQMDTFFNGGSAMRFILLKAGNDLADLAAGSKRSEVDRNKVDPPGTEKWYAGAYYFPSTQYLFDNDPEIFFQLHHAGSTGSPPFALRTWKGKYYCVTRLTPDADDINDELGPIIYNSWVSIVVHYKAASDGTGINQIWINGVLVKDYTGPTAFAGQGNYPKTGIYKWNWHAHPERSSTSERVLYLDDFRIGNENATYDDVAP